MYYIYSSDGENAQGGLRKTLPEALKDADKATRISAGWYDYVSTAPEHGAEEIVVCTSFKRLGDDFTGVYTVTPSEPVAGRKYSKLKLLVKLTQDGLWDALEAWMKETTVQGIPVYTAFLSAQELTDGNELFTPFLKMAQQALGVSDAKVVEILDASVLDE